MGTLMAPMRDRPNQQYMNSAQLGRNRQTRSPWPMPAARNMPAVRLMASSKARYVSFWPDISRKTLSGSRWTTSARNSPRDCSQGSVVGLGVVVMPVWTPFNKLARVETLVNS